MYKLHIIFTISIAVDSAVVLRPRCFIILFMVLAANIRSLIHYLQLGPGQALASCVRSSTQEPNQVYLLSAQNLPSWLLGTGKTSSVTLRCRDLGTTSPRPLHTWPMSRKLGRQGPLTRDAWARRVWPPILRHQLEPLGILRERLRKAGGGGTLVDGG